MLVNLLLAAVLVGVVAISLLVRRDRLRPSMATKLLVAVALTLCAAALLV